MEQHAVKRIIINSKQYYFVMLNRKIINTCFTSQIKAEGYLYELKLKMVNQSRKGIK